MSSIVCRGAARLREASATLTGSRSNAARAAEAAEGQGLVRLPRQRGLKRVFCALAPLAYLALLGATVGLSELVARLVNDDASYYILVAKNLFELGPSYDGVSLTNGVHPLFTLLLGTVYRLLPLEFSQLSTASVVLCVALGSSFVYVLLGIRAGLCATRVALVALMSSAAVYPILYRGMEGALALLVMALYLSAVAHRRAGLVLVSALSTALWAARLELMAFAPIVIILGGSGRLTPPERRRLWLGWLLSCLVFGLAALASYWFIGLALPVSGLIKQLNPSFLPIFFVLGGLALLASLVLAGAPTVASSRRFGQHAPRMAALARRLASGTGGAWMTRSVLAFMAVFYLSHSMGRVEIQQQTWYYFPLPALLACALLELEDLGPRAPHAAAAVSVAVALVATVWEAGYVIPLRAESWRHMVSIAARAKQDAAPGERFMGPGWMGLVIGPEFEPFSHDGLVGGAGQYRAIREGRALAYAYDHGVRYLFTRSPGTSGPAAPVLPPPWQLQRVASGEVPTGRSVWAFLFAEGNGCGLVRCSSRVSVYRLSQHARAERAP